MATPTHYLLPMGRSWYAGLAIVALLHCCRADDVIELTSGNFDETIASHGVILVEFYAPWCGHCQRLAPEYEKAARELASEGIPLAKVDATEQKELTNRFNVQGFPTLKVFHSGTPYDYEGPREAAGIVKYMRHEASPDWQPPKDNVLVLTKQNFSRVVERAEPVLVEFYAPWCGHCKRLAPEYQSAAADLSRMGMHVHLAKVDATEETELAQQYGVQGYPTLKLFRSGKEHEYTGSRDRQGIVQYMLQQAQPGSKEVTSLKEVSRLRREILDPLVVSFGSSEDDPVIKAHLAAAEVGRGSHVQFAHSLSPELASSYSLTPGDTAIFLPKWFRSQYDPEVKVHHIPVAEEASDVFQGVLEAARPLVGLRVRENEAWYNTYPLLVIYCDVEELEYMRSQVAGLAREFSGRLTVALSSDEEYLKELEELGLGDWGEDVSVGLWVGPRERYAMREETSAESIRTFVEAYFDGELQPVIRSQPKPKKKDGAVTVVVGSTFQEVVMDPRKDVLVEFFAPWCGHCKALEPTYQKLAKKYKKKKNLVVAKFDATANDAPPLFEFTGFPTIFFVPAGTGSLPVRYEEQGRELKDLVAFVEAHATVSARVRDEL